VTKENQRWRQASAGTVVKSLTDMAKYFLELSLLLDALDDYSYTKSGYLQNVFYETIN